MNRIDRSHRSRASATLASGPAAVRAAPGVAGLKTVVAALLAAYGTLAMAALPTGGQLVAGNAVVAVSGNTMTITQASQNAVLNWQSFNIGVADAVRFMQPNSAAVALNRVIGADPSTILGSLSSNGKVFLVNPHGILFGKQAQVNVNGLVASTLDIADSDFLAGRHRFAGASAAGVANLGDINADGGYVALLGAAVSNDGVISARLGSVALAAGSAVTLDVAGDGLLSVKLDAGALDALARNGGAIRADGGQVLLTARSAGGMLQSAVNNTGLIEAQTIDQRNGSIRLMGDMQSGAVNLGGTLDASAPDGGDGGFIETSAASVKVAAGTVVSTKAALGGNGRWLIDPTDYTISADLSGNISGADLSSALVLGNVDILSSGGGVAGAGDIHVNGAVSWGTNQLTLTAANNINLNALMSVTGVGSVALNPATANGADPAVAGGRVLAGMDGGGFTGRLDFSGSGNVAISGVNYTVINDLAALRGMALGGNYVLGSNIDASATAGALFTPIGGVINSGYNAPNRYSGSFDGLGHTINGLTISMSSKNDVGLFGMTQGARIYNVGLVGGSVTGGFAVGSLVGYATANTRIGNSYSSAAVDAIGQNVGGLVGATDGVGSIDRSFTSGSVTANGPNRAWTGGLIGNNTVTLTNSYSTSVVTSAGGINGASGTGGLAGRNSGAISDSYATGAVNGDYGTGGLVGMTDGGSVLSSHATGNVWGGTHVGGLIGLMESGGSVTNSYASGSPTANYGAGGLIGSKGGATITGSWYQGGTVTALGYVGGLFGDFGGTVNNSFYDIDSVTIRGGAGAVVYVAATPFGLYGAQYADWRANGPLNIANYAATLVPNGAYYDVGTTAGLKDMLGFSEVSSYKFRLSADIDLAGVAGWSLPRFYANEFDGAGHTLSNLNVFAPNSGWVGMIGLNGGNVHDIHLTNASVAGSDSVGLLAGINVGAISASTTSGTVVASSVNAGGLAGSNSGAGTITTSSANATITGVDSLGGLVGHNDGGISASHASGAVGGLDSLGGLVGLNSGSIATSHASTVLNGRDRVGGLVGSNSNSVTTSYAQGAVSGNNKVGGLVGYNSATVNTSYASGDVNGVGQVGGLVGHNIANIDRTYASGAVTGTTDVGGLLGWNSGGNGGQGGFGMMMPGTPGATGTSGTLSNSYASGAVTGGTNVGALAGRNSGGTGGAGGPGMMAVGGVGGTGGSAAINTSYASGLVTGSAGVGGLVGDNSTGATGPSPANMQTGAGGAGGSAAVASSYWDTTTTGQLTSPAGSGLDTAGMMRKSSFSGFDFATTPVWGFVTAGSSYPVLCAFGACGSGVTAVYINPVSGTSVYGSAPLPGYTLVDVNGAPLTLNGAAFADPAAALYSGLPTAAGNVGMYGFSYSSGLSLTGSDTASYTLAPWGTPSAWSVTPATLTVTADSVMRGYGAANPAIGATYSGFVNGDTMAALSAAAVGASGATSASNVGTYATTASGAAASNYSMQYEPGVLTVNPAVLAVSADNVSRLYGSANPAFAVSYSGFVNGETATALASPATAASGATSASGVGQYAIVAGGAAASNYVFTYQDGVLNVTPASVNVLAASGSRLYGGANPALGASYSGFVNGETAAVLDTAASVATGAGATSGVGQYAVVASGAAAANYTFTYQDGVLNVTPASVNVLADSGSRLYGGANPALGASYSGFVNGETAAVLDTAASVATGADATSGVGQYTVVASGAAAANYNFTYQDGVLNVNPAALTATALSTEAIYGGATPALAVAYSGFVNGDTVSALITQASATAAGGTNAGSYAITASGASAANYVVAYVDGALTIRPAALSIRANDATRTTGTENPAFSATYSGFKYADTATALSGTLALTTPATIASAAGTYAIVPSGLTGANYTISYQAGALAVTPAAVVPPPVVPAPIPFVDGLAAAVGSAVNVAVSTPAAQAPPMENGVLTVFAPTFFTALSGLNVTVGDAGIMLPVEAAEAAECTDLSACLRRNP